MDPDRPPVRSTPPRFGIYASAVLGALAVAVLVNHFFRGCELSASPDLEVIGALQRTEHEGLSLAVPGSREPLISHRHRFQRIAVSVDFDRGMATAHCTLDFTGKLGDVSVSSLGLETIPFRRGPQGWAPAESLAPRLVGALSALARRRAALNAGDAAGLARLWGGQDREGVPPGDGGLKRPLEPAAVEVLALGERSYQVTGWFLRSERDEVLVREEYRVRGNLPDRPVDRTGSRRLTLISREGAFLFWPSLM